MVLGQTKNVFAVCSSDQQRAALIRGSPDVPWDGSLTYEQLGDNLSAGDDFVGEGIFSAVVGEREAGMVEAETV